MAEELKKFGKYFLLDHLAQGGFADIYRARLATPEGASRIIVIKRIQAGHDANSEFIQMFRSETKTSMALNHPNIVQVFDVGEENSQPFIAMELVYGRNLRQILTRYGEQQKNLNVVHAAYIIEQAARALAYAHEFRDGLSGQALNLVHRDISPQNIMVSYEGLIKVIDFGIAKATTNSEHTRTGVIKGKPSYFSPEQITGEELDGRSDLFALGIVMWELLTGRKLFAGESDIAIIRMIEDCNSKVVPPSNYNSQIPKTLDNIVLRALQRERDHRFQRSGELARELQRFIMDADPEFQHQEIADEMRRMFGEMIDEDQKKLKTLNERAEALIVNMVKEPPPPLNRTPTPPARENRVTKPKDPIKVLEAPLVIDNSIQIQLDPKNPLAQRGTRDIGLNRVSSNGRPMTSTVTRGATPARGRTGSSNSGDSRRLAVGAAAALALLGITSRLVPIPYVTPLTDSLLGAQTASLVLLGDGDIQIITINDRPIDNLNANAKLPYILDAVPAGKPLRITVEGSQGRHVENVALDPGGTVQRHVVWLNRSPTGSSTGPESAQGEERTEGMELSFAGYPNGPGTSIQVNGQTLPEGMSKTKAPEGVHYLDISVQRSGWAPFQVQHTKEKIQELRGLIEYHLNPPEPRGNLKITTGQGQDFSIKSNSSGQIIHEGQINRDEMILPLPVGTYTITLKDPATGSSKETLAEIRNGLDSNATWNP